MARACSACIHPSRADIDQALVVRDSIRDVAGRFHLSRTAVGRHAQHLPVALATAADAAGLARDLSTFDRLRLLELDARRLLAAAENEGDIRAAVGALKLLSDLVGRVLDVEAKRGDDRPRVIQVFWPDELDRMARQPH